VIAIRLPKTSRDTPHILPNKLPGRQQRPSPNAAGRLKGGCGQD